MNEENNPVSPIKPTSPSPEAPVPAAPGPAAGASNLPPTPTTPPPAAPITPAPTPAAAATPSPAPSAPAPVKPTLKLSAKPMGTDKPLTNQQIERAVKLPGYAKQFSSPMPTLDEKATATPGWHAGLAALAAVAAVGSAVLLFLKTN